MKFLIILSVLFLSLSSSISFASENKFLKYFKTLSNDNEKGISCYHFAEQMFYTYEPMFILDAKTQDKYIDLYTKVASMKLLFGEKNFMEIGKEGYLRSKDINFMDLDKKLSSYCVPKINVLLKNYSNQVEGVKQLFEDQKIKAINISKQINDQRNFAKKLCNTKFGKEVTSKKLTCIINNVRKLVKGTTGTKSYE